jgi:CubicO group peptidase (beta-lactamase class C family)
MTSHGEPGTFFAYSGARYGLLQKLIERASGRSFPSLMIENILAPLEMNDSIPVDMIRQPAYTHILDRFSRPYGMNQTYKVVFGTASRLVSTVTDLADFDIALDKNQLISPETKALMFTAQSLSSGDQPAYGLGWFVQEFDGMKSVMTPIPSLNSPWIKIRKLQYTL